MGVRGEVFSTKVSLQNRTYFFNVKENRLGDLYLNIVESKNRDEGGFERQSVILFADDLQDFLQGFDEALKVLEKEVRDKRRGKRSEGDKPREYGQQEYGPREHQPREYAPRGNKSDAPAAGFRPRRSSPRFRDGAPPRETGGQGRRDAGRGRGRPGSRRDSGPGRGRNERGPDKDGGKNFRGGKKDFGPRSSDRYPDGNREFTPQRKKVVVKKRY